MKYIRKPFYGYNLITVQMSLFVESSAFGIGKIYSGCVGATAGADKPPLPFAGIVNKFRSKSLDLNPSPKSSILLSIQIVFTKASAVEMLASGKT